MKDQILSLVEKYLGRGHFSGEENVSVRCPFHKGGQEARPSFSVNVTNGVWQCLAGETKVLTKNGNIEIRNLIGEQELLVPSKTLEGLTGPGWEGVWKKAKISSYGQQRLWEITLTRNGKTKIIRATKMHRWFVQMGNTLKKRELFTNQLRPGHRLSMLFSQSHKDRGTIPSPFGIAHGFVFGDGNNGGEVTLWGEKDAELIGYFPKMKIRERITPNGIRGKRLIGFPKFFKELPALEEANSYIVGFLAGYFAADGCVSEAGHAAFASACKETLEKVRTLCTKVGIATSEVRGYQRLGKGTKETYLYSLSLISSSVNDSFFLLSSHKKRIGAQSLKYERIGWYVRGIRDLGITEEVFCAEVPGEGAFTLEDNILTGNCFTCHTAGPLHKLLHGLGLSRQQIDIELSGIKEELQANRKNLEQKRKTRWLAKDPFAADVILPETLLKLYEWCPISLVSSGFDEKWLQWLDIGFDRLNNRVMYPIRDIYGSLAGMSGGTVIAGTYPKYKVYQGCRIDPISGKQVGSDYGTWFDETYPKYEFHNHHYLWNFDQVYPRIFFGKEQQTLVIVEGFKACIWLLQNGWPNTIALMGSSLSYHQRNLLHRLNTNIILFLDNDKAGQEATEKIIPQIRQFQPRVTIAQYPTVEDCQPDNLTSAELQTALQGSLIYPKWKRIYKNVNGWTTQRRTTY